jgi:hypothetical protein
MAAVVAVVVGRRTAQITFQGHPVRLEMDHSQDKVVGRQVQAITVWVVLVEEVAIMEVMEIILLEGREAVLEQ